MPRYQIRIVDNTNDSLCLDVMRLHLKVFGTSAEVPTPLEGHWWAVYWGKKVVGFASMKPSISRENGGYLARSGIEHEHRGNGLQKRLILAREVKARRLGWTILVSDTTENPHSAKNLAACGYKQFVPPVRWGHPETIYWRKSL